MTKKLLFSLVAIAIAANVAIAQVATPMLLQAKTSAPSKQHNRTMVQKAPMADDTQVLLEDFEQLNQDNMMPEGWVVVDALQGVNCANIAESTQGQFGAFSEDYGLTSMYDDENSRDAWAIAPAITLEAGQTYHVGIYAFCMGYASTTDEWQLTVGTSQSVEAQTTVVIDHTGSNATRDSEWILCTGTFTPATTGSYYLAIHHCTQATGGNMAMWDYLQVDSDHIRFMPEGFFRSKGGLWSLDQFMADANGNYLMPRVYTYEGEQFEFSYYAENCESVMWDFGSYGNPSESDEASPIISYDLGEGKDEVATENVLIMMNEDGEAYSIREFYINRVHNEKAFFDFVGNFKPEDNLYTLSDNGTNEALCGLNSSYRRIAERFDRPADSKITVAGFYLVFGNYKMSPVHINKTYTARILQADANGMPGNVLFSKEYKFSETMGKDEISSGYLALAPVVFESEVEVTGSFFIELELPEITPSSNNRLFIAHCYDRENDDCSTYYYNSTDIAGKPAGWYNAYDFYGRNICCGIYPNVLFNDKTAVIAPSMAACTVYANGSELNVVNAKLGSKIVVTDIAGRVVLTATANNLKTTINTGLNEGIYIVTVDGVSTKISIR